MKKKDSLLLLLILSFFSTSFIGPTINDNDLAEYEVRFTFTGYVPFSGGVGNCSVNVNGKAILSGILKVNENTGADDPVLYTGTLQLSINVDICSIKREANGEDKFCTMTVTGSGPVNTELEIDSAAGYGYIKIKYDPSLGKFARSVSGSCDQLQMTEEQKMVPNETVAAIFNGFELTPLTNRTLTVGRYIMNGEGGDTVVEVIRKIQ